MFRSGPRRDVEAVPPELPDETPDRFMYGLVLRRLVRPAGLLCTEMMLEKNMPVKACFSYSTITLILSSKEGMFPSQLGWTFISTSSTPSRDLMRVAASSFDFPAKTEG